MSIVFFEMQGCGHCVRSKQVLADAIAQGLVVVKPASEAGSWAKGFPAFKVNGKWKNTFRCCIKL